MIVLCQVILFLLNFKLFSSVLCCCRKGKQRTEKHDRPTPKLIPTLKLGKSSTTKSAATMNSLQSRQSTKPSAFIAKKPVASLVVQKEKRSSAVGSLGHLPLISNPVSHHQPRGWVTTPDQSNETYLVDVAPSPAIVAANAGMEERSVDVDKPAGVGSVNSSLPVISGVLSSDSGLIGVQPPGAVLQNTSE